MKCSVSKREWTSGGETRVAWMVRYRDREGKQRSSQFKLKREADAAALRIESEMATGTHMPASTSISVTEATSLWLDDARRRGVSDGTLTQYEQHKRIHIDPRLGETKLAKLTPTDIEAFKDAVIDVAGATMAKKVLVSLRSALDVAIRKGKVATNVAKAIKVDAGKRQKTKATPPPQSHLIAMIEAAERLEGKHRGIHAMLMLVALTGLRQGEIRALNWTNIDLLEKRITVTQSADRRGNIQPPKSDAGIRSIPIGSMLVTRLKAWQLACPPNALGLVFPNEGQQVMSQHRMTDLLGHVQLEAGIVSAVNGKVANRYGWHDFRHQAASAWIAQKVDLKRLQTWLGHATIQLTLDTYGHLLPDADADMAYAEGAEGALFRAGAA